MPRQQFNVSLDAELVRRVKHHAIDVQMSLSDLVAHALEAQLSGDDLRLRPMLHVTDMAAAVDFFTRLGGELQHGSRDGDWSLIRLGAAQLGLLAHPPNPEQQEGTVELNFECTGPLDALEERLRAAGVPIERPTTDEAFGRQLQLRTPDGLLVKIDELDPSLFT